MSSARLLGSLGAVICYALLVWLAVLAARADNWVIWVGLILLSGLAFAAAISLITSAVRPR